MTILEGVNRQGADGRIAMPAFRNDLSDRQVAAISNFVAQNFGNPGLKVSDDDVSLWRNGGPQPLIARLGAWLVYGPLIVVVVILLAIYLLRRRSKISTAAV